MFRCSLLTLLLFGTLAWAEPPKRQRGEFLQMWDAIVSGDPMMGDSGWFKPSDCRYTWERLQMRADADKDGRVTLEEFAGSKQQFTAIDRNGDNVITADDLDWSENALYFRQLGLAQQLLRRGDDDGNRKLTKEEWAALFDKAAKDKPAAEAEDLRRLLFPPAPPPRKGGGGMPPMSVLLYGFLTGELGSGAEGPKLNGKAPDFTLKSPDGKTTINMTSHRGKRPVVLVFGSFT